MCTNLSSQTLSYTKTLLQPTPSPTEGILGCQFLLFTLHTLPIIQLVCWGITFVPRCTREM